MPNLQILPQFSPFLSDHRYKVAIGGRSAGRSVAAAQALIYFCENARIRVLSCREWQSSIEESSKAQIEEVIDGAGLRKNWRFAKMYTENLKTGSVIIYRGIAVNPRKVKSIPGIDIAMVEECELLSKESLNTLELTVRKPGSEIWLLGNPHKRTDAIPQAFLEGTPPPRTVIMRSNYLTNPFCSKEFLQQAEHMRRTDPAGYRHHLLGEYLDTQMMRMIPSVTVDDGSAPVRADDIVVFGVDVAAEGGDRTVIVIRKGRKIIDYHIYPVMDEHKLVQELQALIRQHKPHRINVDATGFGHYAPAMLKGHGIKVEGINFGGAAREDKVYANKRAELYGNVKRYFENGGTIPNDPQLIEELECSWYDLDKMGRYLMRKKSDIRAELGRSPDCSDGVALAIETGAGDMFRAPKAQTVSHNEMSDLIKSGMFST